MIIQKFSKAGACHDRDEEKNQDYVCSGEDDQFLTVMLADGAGACSRGREGARLACRAAADMIGQERENIFAFSPKKLAYLLTEHILYYLETFKCGGEDIHEYGSTFAMACMEKKTGKTVMVNLGDGAVFKSGGGSLLCQMKPKRFYGDPCLTTTEGAYRAMEAGCCRLSLGEGIFICSDGALDQIKTESVLCTLKTGDTDTLKRVLEAADHFDDCSFIAFTRERR